VIDSGEVLRGEKMAPRGTDPATYITEYTVIYEDNTYAIFDADISISVFISATFLS